MIAKLPIGPITILLAIAALPIASGAGARVIRDPGRIAFVSNQVPGQIQVVRPDGSGQRPVKRNAFDFESEPAWSPDERWMAFVSDHDGDTEIYVMNANGRKRRQLTRNDADDHDPAWSPDGRRIAFERNDGLHDDEIHVVNADGTDERQLTANTDNDYSPDWSPDGRRIAFASERDGDRRDIYVMNADGTGQRLLAQNSSGAVWRPALVGRR